MRVFVYQAYVPAGGTYMAYHIGRIMHEHFGMEVLAVGARPVDSMFTYPLQFPVIGEDRLALEARADDLLVCNPSFSSELFGLRLPCRKLSYVQNIRTFAVLDVFFDHYVFVSEWVRRFVSAYYGIEASVIPAFIDTALFRAGEEWGDRESTFLVAGRKHESVVFQRLLEVYSRMYPDRPLPWEIVPVVPQEQLAARFRAGRYYLSLDTMEGFGLPMLEAMACGCAVAGWDSGGCHEYARAGENVLLARYGDFEALARALHRLLEEEHVARALGAAGVATGLAFGRDRFDRAWVRELSAFLGTEPRAGP